MYASRGYIRDRNGMALATTEMTFSLEMYKSKIDTDTLNETILYIINTLEENGDSYIDTFPININPFSYNFSSDEKRIQWLESHKLDKDTPPEIAFRYFKEKYEIKNENIEEIRKILTLRYRITSEGYSATKSLTISNNISRQSAIIFEEQKDKYPGVKITQNSKRNYPNGKLASHIIGYINSISPNQYKANKDQGYTMNDIYGQTGIEYAFEPFLKGKDGERQIDMSVDGEIVNEYISEDAMKGSDIILTIDANLQEVTEKALVDTINGIKNGAYGNKKYPADAGAIAVMNVTTGEVLALASYPDYEPASFVGGISTETWNYYMDTNNNSPLINRAIEGAYAPGSTYKLVTALSALETGKVTVKEKVNDVGVYPRGHHPVCWIYSQYKRGHGYLNITSAIKQSCNYFFYEMGYRVGIEDLNKYASNLGLGRKTGIELTGESSGTLANPELTKSKGETWTVGYTLNAAIGQGDNRFTPIQMAKYISILVNGGKQVKPTIVRSVLNPDGSEVSREEIQKTVSERLGTDLTKDEDIQISDENLEALLEGMRGVTSESGGTAYSIFKNFNIEVGGKTGSAQTKTTANAWFVGYAPYDNPEIAIAVVIEKRRFRKSCMLCSKRYNSTILWYE